MTITTLLSIPPTPAALRLAAEQGRLVPFVGAGASRLAGAPGWREFADGALAQCQDSADDVADIIRGELSPRIKLGLAQRFAAQTGKQIDYDRILHPPGWETHAQGQRIYQALSGLSRNFVTTNYDRWLDSFVSTFPPDVSASSGEGNRSAQIARDAIYRPDDLHYSKLDRAETHTVVHLHGSVQDANSMVMSTRQYIDRYAYHGEKLGALGQTTTQLFLNYLFGLKTVLFVGYGLEELEILEYVILKAARPSGSHYILQGYLPTELALANRMAAYFEHECGVTLIPFQRNDHADMIDVIESFARDIQPGPVLKQEQRFTMDALLNG